MDLQYVNVLQEKEALINFVYPNLCEIYTDRAILAPFNKTVNEINKAPGQVFTYVSFDTAITEEGCIDYSTEFLNSIESGCLPPHILSLKIGTPIIILRNLRPPHMVNGSRAIVTRLHGNVIEAKSVLNNQLIFIPRVTLAPSDNSNEIIFRRKQFPVKPAYV